MSALSNLFEFTLNRFVYNRLVFICFFLIIWCACNQESTSTEAIQGKWLLIAAERGGIPTTTLKDAYFSFIGDTLLRTNLLQEDRGYKYSFDGEEILQKGSTDIRYKILHLQEDTMVLNSTIRKYDFTFLLVRDSVKVSAFQ